MSDWSARLRLEFDWIQGSSNQTPVENFTNLNDGSIPIQVVTLGVTYATFTGCNGFLDSYHRSDRPIMTANQR